MIALDLAGRTPLEYRTLGGSVHLTPVDEIASVVGYDATVLYMLSLGTMGFRN